MGQIHDISYAATSPNDVVLRYAQKIISEQFGTPESSVHRDSMLTTDLGMDSLDSVELVMRVEDDLSIEIADGEVDRIESVQEMVLYLEQYRSKIEELMKSA